MAALKRYGLLLLLAVYSLPLLAAPATPLLLAVQQQLAVEQARNSLLVNRLQALQHSSNQEVTATADVRLLLRRADLAIAMAKADLEDINLTLAAAQQAVILTESNIQTLTNELQASALTSGPQPKTLTQLQEQQALLSLQRNRVKVMQRAQNLVQQTLVTAQAWRAQLQASYLLQQRQQRQQALDRLATTLQQEQQGWLTHLTQLNKQLQTLATSNLVNSPIYNQLEQQIFEAQERSSLSQLRLEMARLHNRLEDLLLASEQGFSLTTLTTAQRQIGTLIAQLEDMDGLLDAKVNLLQKRIQIVRQNMQNATLPAEDGSQNLQVLYQLLASNKAQLTAVTNLKEQARTNYQIVATKLGHQLSNRQGFPGLDRFGWLKLGEKLIQIPLLTWQVVNNLYKAVIEAMWRASLWQLGLWGAAFIGWIILWIKARRYLAVAVTGLARREERFLTNNAFLIFIRLLGHHLPGFMVIGGLAGLFILMGIPLPSFNLFISLALVILIFSLALGLARFLLLENTRDIEGHDVRLYRRLRWILPLGGFLTALTVLVHQLPISYDVQDLFGRLFMVLLVMTSLGLLRAWIGLPALLEPFLGGRPYLKQMVRWLSLLIPFTLFSNGLIGLVGYVELAWSIVAYQGLFLVVLSGYFLAMGLLSELMRMIAEQLIRRLRNGWLWSEALLKPLHLILKITLMLWAGIILLTLFGWGEQSWVMIKLGEFLELNLLTIADSIITPISLIKLFIIIAIFVWATRWTREFAYRWLFSSTKDVGLRNSLAVFSQYMVVTIGIFIALRISGLNLTALAFIASAFAVGIGFGLRDLANNFMSGMLLLLERPARVGDYVTVGPYEGEVTHIGMRSITVLTDDRQELLVPNAMVFTQAFINWTRHDSIVRTVVILKINRDDDPHRVKDIILEVVKSIPRVLAKPAPEVFFKDIDDMLLKFHLDYFVDMRQGSIRVVRSQVLFALWDRFAAEGIHPPEVPHEILLSRKSEEQIAKS